MLRSSFLICLAAGIAFAQGGHCPLGGKPALSTKRPAPDEVPVERPTWREMTRVTPVTVTGEAASAEKPRHERPLLVYVYDATDPEARFRVDDMKAFSDARVACAVRFFDCVRVKRAAAANDPALRGKPRFVLLQRDYTAHRSVAYDATPGRIFGALNGLLRKAHKVNVESVLRRHKKLRRDRAALEGRLERAPESAKPTLETKLEKLTREESALYTLE